MKVIVIGLGSMGKRRIRLMQKRNDVELIAGIDSQEDRRKECEETLGISTYISIDDAVKSTVFDCAFICTSPLSHSAIIKECLENGLHVFTEINLVPDGYQDNLKLAKEKNKVLFLSSTFMYREETQYIHGRVVSQIKPVNYMYHIGQYLPDWHPWETYKSFFVGDKRTNGCREIMAIELPWISEAFGEISSIKSAHDKMSSLEVDYDDNYIINIEHKNGNKGILVIDVVSRRAVRNFEAYSEDLYLTWNGTPQGLAEYSIEKKNMESIQLYDSIEHTEGYQATVIENAYTNEIEEFFSVVRGEREQTYGFEKDFVTLQWLDRIEGVQ